MPMNEPAFTTNEDRVERLRANYNEGVLCESMPTTDREERDQRCLHVSHEKLIFLFQNAMEDYSRRVKNQKVREYNEAYMWTSSLPSQSHDRKFRFPF
ncbi:hypothetical protein LSCM1_06049 [Leishmania martiniquensis]|uniref:Uncharacterized protein n=1 Tax=Leishmania martiniquensis TaxID=1580590 RepID=A0A836HKT5_9TRYP|nr:hypothetical protein LSCM1_06049 [Leishmania martiniquensis]